MWMGWDGLGLWSLGSRERECENVKVIEKEIFSKIKELGNINGLLR